MKIIKLRCGASTYVSNVDYTRLVKYSWRLIRFGRKGQIPQFYVACYTKGKTVLMHRLILGLNNPETLGDHKNHDPLDNRRRNLRKASKSQNNANSRKRRGTYSRFKGVTFHYKNRKWIAQIKVNTVNHYLGSFDIEADAGEVYKTAAKKLFRKFAFTTERSQS